MNYTDIIIKLRKVIRSINLESKRIEKEHGISIPQLLCLQYLSTQEDYRATSSMIKDHLNLNASTVSGIIKRLEAKGLVARLPKPNDKRATYITLTAKGMDLLKASPTTLQHKLSTRLSLLPSEQITALNEGIDLLISLLDAEDIDAAPIITSQEIP
jgi:DNA-binding MarR family transcriptional regulator